MSDAGQLSELELDALRELMNIGFGQAAAVLSEVIDLKIALTVPKLDVIGAEEVPGFIGSEIFVPNAFGVVEQFFFGTIDGTSFLVLPEVEGNRLARLLGTRGMTLRPEAEAASLERDVVTEIGNIIIGACVGRIADLLKEPISFRPPQYLEALDSEGLENRLSRRGERALVMKAVFRIEGQDVFGYLFIVVSGDSLERMRGAVNEYLESLG